MSKKTNNRRPHPQPPQPQTSFVKTFQRRLEVRELEILLEFWRSTAQEALKRIEDAEEERTEKYK